MRATEMYRNKRIQLAAGVVALVAALIAMAAFSEGGTREPDKSGASAGPSPKTEPHQVDPDIVHETEDDGKAVNLTLDDGPDPEWTPRALELLGQNGAKATFCMTGPNAQAHPDLVKKVVAAGHRLCDHSMSHDTAMDKKSVEYQQKEILDAKKLIEAASGGAKVHYYRAPGGAFTPDSRRTAADNGMRNLGWNVDPSDYMRPGSTTILQRVKRQLSQGPTILLHDGGGNRSQTMEALEELLPWLKEQGYGFSFPKAG
ncbi:polysaccharide deacetylase family protein [Streptomyces sp. NPDC001262]|uniref:polysaccharide deacetylase family protein n=1 Tax=unclassified Streptomyces TaxID=2593676 RepID=UPI00369F46A5